MESTVVAGVRLRRRMLLKEAYLPHHLASFVNPEVYCLAREGAVVDHDADLSWQASKELRILSLMRLA